MGKYAEKLDKRDMAAAAAAALLDELMGRQRNIDPTSAKREPKWDDEEVS